MRRLVHDVQPNLLYRFYDAAGRLLYVGVTANLPQRLRGHGKRDWWQDVRTMHAEPHRGRRAVLAAERAAIEQERPLHNVRMNGGTAVKSRRVVACRHGWVEPDPQGVLRCCDCDEQVVA